VIAIALILAVATSSPAKVPITDDIAHAAFVFLDSRGTHPYGTLCLQVDGQDPSPALAVRLRTELKDWVPGSECAEKVVAERRVRVHTRDGATAQFLSLSGAEARGDSAFTVNYSFWAGTFTGSGSALRVELQDGRWQVSGPSGYEWVE
jgi:hypothetical protein